MVNKYYCQRILCGNEIPKPQTCCNGFECGCMGQPVEPPFCSNECYEKYMRRGKLIKIHEGQTKLKIISEFKLQSVSFIEGGISTQGKVVNSKTIELIEKTIENPINEIEASNSPLGLAQIRDSFKEKGDKAIEKILDNGIDVYLSDNSTKEIGLSPGCFLFSRSYSISIEDRYRVYLANGATTTNVDLALEEALSVVMADLDNRYARSKWGELKIELNSSRYLKYWYEYFRIRRAIQKFGEEKT